MTINSPAAPVLAMYVGVADRTGVDRAALSGTLQNDILKEYQAQKEYVFPPRPSVRLVTDVMRFCSAELPRWHPVSVSGYHIREAGSTAAQELAFTLANGFAYVEAAMAAGMAVDDFAPRLSFFFNAHSDFFEEIAKYRAARRIWARWMRERYGAADGRSCQLRFHTQTAGVSLTAQQPEVNLVRVAIEALAGVLGGTQSLHTDAFDEALALPTEHAARLALRTQQVIAEETGRRPRGRSARWIVVRRGAHRRAGAPGRRGLRAPRPRPARGRCSRGSSPASTTVGSSRRSPTRPTPSSPRSPRANGPWSASTGTWRRTASRRPPSPSVPTSRRSSWSAWRPSSRRETTTRSGAALARIAKDASDPAVNLMPALIEAARHHVTVGESMRALESVFGLYVERHVA